METPLRAAIRGPFAALGEVRKGVVGGRSCGLVGDEASVRKFQVVLIRGTLEHAAKEWTEMGMDHEWSHADGVTEPLDSSCRVACHSGRGGAVRICPGRALQARAQRNCQNKRGPLTFFLTQPRGGFVQRPLTVRVS